MLFPERDCSQIFEPAHVCSTSLGESNLMALKNFAEVKFSAVAFFIDSFCIHMLKNVVNSPFMLYFDVEEYL